MERSNDTTCAINGIYTILDIPVWVWIICVHLIFIGLRATKKRTISRSKLLIVPSIFLIVLFRQLMITAAWRLILVSLLSLILGFMMNWASTKKTSITIEGKYIIVPGTWQVFVLVMVNFLVKYVLSYMHVENPALAFLYSVLKMVVSGLSVGCLLGRNLCYYYMSFRGDGSTNM